jgi:hypothetical protein
MRNLLTLSAAASVLAIGMSAHHAAALSLGANSISPQGLVLKVQKSDEKGPATRDGGKSGDSGARGQDGGGKGTGPSATQEKGSDRGAAQDKGGDRGTQMRSGDKGARGEGARSQQRSSVDVDVRGRRADRADRRTRVDVDRKRRSGGRDVDVNVRGYGYSPAGCQELLRRYRQCTAR